MLVVLLLGFASGLPLGLTAGTLQAWMKTANVDIGTIGLFSLVGLPYSLKFIWSPIMDRYVPPLLGRRRGWILLTQLGLVITIASLGFCDPQLTPKYMAFFAVCVAFFSASQDIAIDAYRIEVLDENELGAGASVNVMGYRIAMIVSSALALILSDHIPWSSVYLIMAACMLVGIVASIFGPEPKNSEAPPKTLTEAVYKPFTEFFSRAGAVEMLIFILIYKLDVAFAMALTTPFMMDLGFTKTDIGAVLKGVGMFSTIGGTLVGGAVLSKWGIKKSLWIFGIIQALSGFSFFLLAKLGHNYPMMVTAVCVENICSGLATAAFTAFMMNICDKRYTATQFALLTSFMAITRTLVQTPSGFIMKSLGWEMYFIVSIVISIPGLLLLTRYNKWQVHHQPGVE
ncbi:MAG: AmpG family muropeptide MFS transporter [Bacteriovorax sp.]|nr:AmpG family muropeptide MFS transporter [Bacteriovorax sp.]